MQHKIKAIFIIIAIFFVSSVYGENLYKAEIIKLSDADSMWISMNGIRFKLIIAGIDAPEEFKSRKLRRDSKRCNVSQKRIRKLGRIATNYAKSLLSRGDIVKIKIYKKEKKEIYGSLFLPDGSSYSENIVANGYACISPDDGEKAEELSKLKKLLQKARKDKKGLWDKYYKYMECLCK